MSQLLRVLAEDNPPQREETLAPPEQRPDLLGAYLRSRQGGLSDDISLHSLGTSFDMALSDVLRDLSQQLREMTEGHLLEVGQKKQLEELWNNWQLKMQTPRDGQVKATPHPGDKSPFFFPPPPGLPSPAGTPLLEGRVIPCGTSMIYM